MTTLDLTTKIPAAYSDTTYLCQRAQRAAMETQLLVQQKLDARRDFYALIAMTKAQREQSQ